MPNSFTESPTAIDETILTALAEDLAGGDVTTEACIDPDTRAVAYAVARKEMVVCGAEVFARVFWLVDPNVKVEIEKKDGLLVPPGTKLWKVTGRARSMLMGERVALNFAQRMSGVATLAHTYIRAIPVGCSTRITDTRKTTPGLRKFERYAVRTGGARNHRDNLGSAVLIKDNHILACGGVGHAIERAKKIASHTCKIECEIDSLDQLDEALKAGADIILLDNMENDEIAEAVRRAKGKAILEASGGITLERVAELSRLGVDAISVGALTHSAPAADIGLDFAGEPKDSAGEDAVSKVSLRA
ncbi:MAG: carboxylating nicotinate-nucleotide diphosphorylase [Polyangiaceae bacterium]|nr:carboxylating nicotinate-nucleotide diphosphorylase [Polyangiaceae bacterium]